MELLHQTVDIARLSGIFDFPSGFGEQQVEVIVRSVDAPKSGLTNKTSAYGCLREYANPAKIAGESGVWERAAAEGYAKS